MDQGQLFRRVLARALLLSARRFNQLCTLSLATHRVQPCVVAYGPVRQAGKFDLMWLRRTFSVRANISAFKRGNMSVVACLTTPTITPTRARNACHHHAHSRNRSERCHGMLAGVSRVCAHCNMPFKTCVRQAVSCACACVCVCARGAQRGVQPHLVNFNWNRSGQTNSSWWLTPHGATLCLLCSKFVSTLRSRIHHAV